MTITTWARAALVRAIKTASQTMVALIGTGYLAFSDVDWGFCLSAAGVAGVLSILTSMAGLPEVKAEEALSEVCDELEEIITEDGTDDPVTH